MEVLGGIPIKQQFLFFLFPQPLVTTTLLLNLTALYTSYRWKWKLLSHIRPFATAWTIQSLYSQGQNTGVGSLSLLQGSSQPKDWTQVSLIAGGSFTSWATVKPKNTGVSSLSLLQQIFPTQGLNPGLLHCRWILYQLSHSEAQEYWSR